MTDIEDSEIEIPQVYKHHAFACFTQRPPGHPRGSCGASGAQPLWDRLGKALEAEGHHRDWFHGVGMPWLLQGRPPDGGISGRNLVPAGHTRGHR
jgi:hypothetical protein